MRTSSQPPGGSGTGKGPRTSGGFWRWIAGMPGKVRSLAREGKHAEASLYCLLIGGLAFIFLSVWSLVLSVTLLALGVSTLGMPQGGVREVLMTGAYILLALPLIGAALICLAGTAIGTGLGFVGLVRGEGNALVSILAMLLNLGLLGFLAVILWLALAAL